MQPGKWRNKANWWIHVPVYRITKMAVLKRVQISWNKLHLKTCNSLSRNDSLSDQSKKNGKAGPDRKNLDRWNACKQPIKFKDSGFRMGEMLQKTQKHNILNIQQLTSCVVLFWTTFDKKAYVRKFVKKNFSNFTRLSLELISLSIELFASRDLLMCLLATFSIKIVGK